MNHVTLDSQKALEEAILRSSTNQKLVIVGKTEDLASLEENAELNAESPTEIVEKSNQVDALEWFVERKKELEEDWEVDLSESEGQWPSELPPQQGFVLNKDSSTGKELKAVACLSLQVDHSWMIPAELRYGGWNECPFPEVHCAIWRYWEEKYGARIIGVSSDVIEAYVDNPPATAEEAMELARQQYLYCSDIVDQGVETVANLAASLIDNKFWFFWWD